MPASLVRLPRKGFHVIICDDEVLHEMIQFLLDHVIPGKDWFVFKIPDQSIGVKVSAVKPADPVGSPGFMKRIRPKVINVE